MADPELLDLDAIVFADYWTDVLDTVVAAAPHARRVVDLGAGTGSGALGLALRLPGAEVVAVDSSAEMLDALASKGGRVTTLQCDLDAGWPDLGGAKGIDITFASMALHHVADPAGLLGQLYDATNAAGIVAAAEFREPVRVLRDDVGGGVEARALAALRAGHPLPELHADWPSLLRDAGFEVVVERSYDLDVPAPLGASAQRYADLWLERIARGLAEHGTDVDELTGALRSVDTGDYQLHGRRTLTVARKG